MLARFTPWSAKACRSISHWVQVVKGSPAGVWFAYFPPLSAVRSKWCPAWAAHTKVYGEKPLSK
ncbi:MAG TPA: hypothetical protein VMW72_12565 [Sedimentisphaerales bacterium]|nr:hypothetical protein [Sedimentisphaerales bacterium]